MKNRFFSPIDAIQIELFNLNTKLNQLREQRYSIKAKEHREEIDVLLKRIIELKEEIKLKLDRNASFLDKLIEELTRYKEDIQSLNSVEQELDEIKRGLYQRQLFSFTYDLPEPKEGNRLGKKRIALKVGLNNDTKIFLVYPLIDQFGLKCTASIPLSSGPQDTNLIVAFHSLDTIELHINFFGTIDLASCMVDIEPGGPGQETLKIHEAKLLQQIHAVLEPLSLLYSNKPNFGFRLRLAGHSLGGTLAKGFAHTLQRACAIQNNSASQVIQTIETELEKENELPVISQETFQQLEQKLKADQEQFKGLNFLSKIKKIIVYAEGSAGVSKTTDRDASLLSYYYRPDFLRVYHRYHREDLFPKFGETEFLSNKQGIRPRIMVNQVIQTDIEITEEEIKSNWPYPFPEITSHWPYPFPEITAQAAAAHCKSIYGSKLPIESKVFDLEEAHDLLEKFSFSIFKQTSYQWAFSIVEYIASFKAIQDNLSLLKSYPEEELDKPDIRFKSK